MDSNPQMDGQVRGSDDSTDMVIVPWREQEQPDDGDLSAFFAAGAEAEKSSAEGFLVASGATSVSARKAVNAEKMYLLVKGGVTEVPGSGGNVRGVEWRSGAEGKGMKQFSEFKAVGKAAQVASTFFTQGMLIYIAVELNAIKKGITEIQNEMFEAEVSRMRGRIDSAEQALRLYLRNHDSQTLNLAIQGVREEILPLLDAIGRRTGHLANKTALFGPGAAKIKRNYDEVVSSVGWSLKGMVALSLMYSIQDPEFGKEEMARQLARFSEKREIAEWLEKTGRTLALEDYGEKYFDDVTRLKDGVSFQRKVLAAPEVGLRLTGRQLAQLQNQVPLPLPE